MALKDAQIKNIVDIRFLKSKKMLASMKKSDSSFTLDDVTKFSIDDKTKEITVGENTYRITSDLLVLLVNEEGAYYYDNQVVDIPQGKCMRQVGVYRYTTKSEMEKTVPVVKLMDL